MKLENETIVETDTCVYTQAIVFVSDKGTIFYTKAGMQKYARLRVTPGVIFSMYFDHLGSLNYISLNSTSADDISVSEMDVQTLLKVNYRPPSVLGIAVPLTENFYNVDPSKPRMRDYFSGSKATGKYKQCANKTNRAGCKCTSNMKVSFSVAFSDCKEKALRMKFPVIKLPLYFTVEEEGRSQNMTSPYFITIVEVNNRTNWRVSGTNLTSSTIKMKKLLEHVLGTELYNPEGLSISIMGSELFHFRVSTIPGASFCNLFDEFQIYVDDPPLAFPGQYLISTITAVAIGGIIFMAFILHVYEIQIGTILKKLKRNKVASKGSFTSVSATSTEISDN
nr:PREDICTED: cation channel sperm-associated protein subunit beta [Anolis carolinensis]|eukprot:XP_016846437.1 PREDICTED: cation channel sperm-associated protein subunit beta [Anolis carolinensis]